MIVSADTIELLMTMEHAWRITGGRLDPTMLAAINEAGYTTSRDEPGRSSTSAGPSHSGATIADVLVDHATSSVVVPAGLGLDAGGIGKGLAADLVVTELLAGGTGGALVSVGGDLAAAGTPPADEGWTVAVEDPFDASRELLRLALEAGGVASSSTQKRTWVRDGRRRHHVLDPLTRSCAATDLAAVTVIARAGWEAEAHATAGLLAGTAGVLDYLGRHGLDGVATTLDGTTLMTPALDPSRVAEGSLA
jgi:FAD:protein FMN transferase